MFLRLLAGLAISIAGLWWAFRSTDWAAFSSAMQDADPWLLALAVVLLFTGLPIRGYRWSLILAPFKHVPTRLTSEATLIGYFGNNVLPVRMGEIVRAYFLARQAGLEVSKVFGTIILERILDMLTILLLLLITPLVAYIPPELEGSAQIGAVLGAALAAFAWWASRNKSVTWLPEKLRGVAENLRSGFASVRQKDKAASILITTILIWASYLGSIYAGLAAMGLQISLAETFSLFVATTIVIAIPSAPGFIGTYHAMAIFMLVNVMGYDLGQAQAAAVMLHAIGFIPYTVFGAIIYFRSHMRLSEVLAESRRAEPSP